MNEYLPSIQAWLESNPGWLGAAIFIIALMESFAIAGIIVPGVALLFVAATLAGTGALSLQGALTLAFLGAVIGDGASYLIGHHFKQQIRSVWPFNRYPKVLAAGEAFFNRHGGKSIVLGRFIGPVRPVIPLIAGTLDMGKAKYFTFNLLSALAWAPCYILPGYMVGASLQSDANLPPHFWWVTGGAATFLCFLYWLFIQTHSYFSEESPAYLGIKRAMRKYQRSQVWRLFSNGRPLQETGEFPLNSLVATAGALALFAILATVSTSGLFDTFNHQTARFFSETRLSLIDPLFVFVTLLGDPDIFYFGFIIFVTVLTFKGHYAAAIHVACAGLATVLLTHGLKDLFGVPRPDIVVDPPGSFAFPSGHTSGATVFFCLMASFVAQELPTNKRGAIYLVSGLPVLLIAVSRLYLEVHWLTDIFGGFLLGIFITGATRFSFSRYDREPVTVDLSVIGAAALFILLSAIHVSSSFEQAMEDYREKASVSVALHEMTRPFPTYDELPTIGSRGE
ncbi:MAG: phosphoesterase [Proteobacteria bacterium]|nr:MAG: phosphoesterase [Pseudomonadota bacterium]